MSEIKPLTPNQRKIALIAGVILISIYIIFSLSIGIYSIFKEPYDELKIFILNPKDFVHIIFFIIIATIGVLSYIRAKKTLFTPIRTETFKMQIKAFEEILLFFQNKRETDLTQHFDFGKILHANSHLMMNDYVHTFFKDKIEINEEAIKEEMKDFTGALVTKEFFEENFASPELYKQKDEEKEEITNPALILSKWNKYNYGKIEITSQYNDEMETLATLKTSPLLPEELKNKIEGFENLVRDNIYNVGIVLTEVSQELPEKFPSANSIKNFDSSEIWNRFNRKNDALEPKALEILEYIRSYLKIEELIEE